MAATDCSTQYLKTNIRQHKVLFTGYGDEEEVKTIQKLGRYLETYFLVGPLFPQKEKFKEFLAPLPCLLNYCVYISKI